MMQASAPSPAPRKSTGIGAPGGLDAAAISRAAQSAAANAASAAESETSQHAVMTTYLLSTFDKASKKLLSK